MGSTVLLIRRLANNPALIVESKYDSEQAYYTPAALHYSTSQHTLCKLDIRYMECGISDNILYQYKESS